MISKDLWTAEISPSYSKTATPDYLNLFLWQNSSWLLVSLETLCEIYPQRREELDTYLAIIADLAFLRVPQVLLC